MSSDATRCACVTPVRNVGGNQQPFAGNAQLDCVNSVELALNIFKPNNGRDVGKLAAILKFSYRLHELYADSVIQK